MRNPKQLTRAEIIRVARTFRWNRKMPKWTAIVEGREIPARPLVLEAAGVPPNDPTNSHQAVDILQRLGFETRYAKERHQVQTNETQESLTATEGLNSILEIAAESTRAVPKADWDRLPNDLSTNLDHYLYGTKKADK